MNAAKDNTTRREFIELEKCYESFCRVTDLPQSVEAVQANAAFNRGVLLTVPKPAKIGHGRRIETGEGAALQSAGRRAMSKASNQ